MNWLDLVILLTLAWFTIAGATAGLLRESITLFSFVLAVILAGLFSDDLSQNTALIVDSERWAQIIAFAAIFFAVSGAGQMLAFLAKSVADMLALGPFDHLLGLVFGVVKGIVIIEAGLFLFVRFPVETVVDAMDSSLLAPVFLDGIPFILRLLPNDFRRAVEQFPQPL